MTTIIVGHSLAVPTYGQMAEALQAVGYGATVENIKGHATTSLIAEIRYAPDRMPLVVHVMHDLIEETDTGDDDYWDWLSELVPEENARGGLRRFIFVDHLGNAEPSAVATVVTFLRDQTDGLIFRT